MYSPNEVIVGGGTFLVRVRRASHVGGGGNLSPKMIVWVSIAWSIGIQFNIEEFGLFKVSPNTNLGSVIVVKKRYLVNFGVMKYTV